MERERRGEKPAVRGRAGVANGERGRRRARPGGRGRGSISGPRVGRAQRRSGADGEAPAGTGGLPGGARRSAGGRGSSGGRTAARALGPGAAGSRRTPRRRQWLLLQD